RGWRFTITNHNRSAPGGRGKQQLREIIRKPNTAVTGRVAGELAGMHRDTGPGKPLHIRHRSVVVFLRPIRLLLIQNREYATGRSVAFGTSAHGGATDQNAVAIYVHHLLRNTNQDHERPLGRDFWMPPILAGLERAGWLTGRRTLGVKGWLFHRLGGCQQANGNGENSYELHAEIGR